MHTLSLNYGILRTVDILPIKHEEEFFSISALGWHRCGDLYCISRESSNSETHLLLLTTGGEGAMEIEGQKYVLTPGSIALVPRKTKNTYYTPAGGEWVFYWLHPMGEISNAFWDRVAAKGDFLAFSYGNSFAEEMEELLRLYDEKLPGFELKVSLVLSGLFHRAAILLNKNQVPTMSEKIKRYIEGNYRKKLQLDEIAGEMFVSKAHMIREFKRETGDTPHSYLIKHRLQIAAQLLSFGSSGMNEIAAEVGFSSSSHFISKFKEHYGCTPTEYRSKKRYAAEIS